MKSLLLLPAALHILCVSAAPAPAPAPNLVTEIVDVITTTAFLGYTRSFTTIPAEVETYTEQVVPKSTPYSAITTITQTPSSGNAGLTYVEIVIPTSEASIGADDPSSGTSTTGTSNALETDFVVNITYTPSPTCSQSWTYVTPVPIDLPALLLPQITPVTIATETSAYTFTEGYGTITYETTTYTSVVEYLNPTDIDSTDLASASLAYEPSNLNYCYSPTMSCYTKTVTKSATTSAVAACSTYFTYPGSDSSYYGGGDDFYDSWYRQTLIMAITIPVGWAFIWLVLGMWENWLSFKGLMLGQSRKRGAPYSWSCIAPLISCLFLCWVGPRYTAKTKEEQAVLKEKWDKYSAGQKFKLWMKWGFRWKYPDCLGDEPVYEKKAVRQRCL